MPTRRRDPSGRLIASVLALVVGFLLACGSGGPEPRPPRSAPPETSSTPASEPTNPGIPGLLPDGRVLFHGYVDHAPMGWLLDPATGSWTPTSTPPRLTAARILMFADGRAGVVGTDGMASFDPATGTWAMHEFVDDLRVRPPLVFTAGRLLAFTDSECEGEPPAAGASFDPTTGAWTPIHGAGVAGDGASATLLEDGRVWVAGGVPNCFESLGSGRPRRPARRLVRLPR